MISLLAKWCIPNRERVEDGAVRRAWGALCGFVGIGLNLLLFAGKLVAGSISGSIAITADAFNNLSDAGSSVVTLLGFRLAGKKPDAGHPFGHGRMEYISGLVVAGLILVMGAELAKSSVDKILHPEAVTFSWLACGILLASIAVKLYMYRYNRAVGEEDRFRRHGRHGGGQSQRHGGHRRRTAGHCRQPVHQCAAGRLGGACGGAVHPVVGGAGGPGHHQSLAGAGP